MKQLEQIVHPMLGVPVKNSWMKPSDPARPLP